jgi:hypothetical protein
MKLLESVAWVTLGLVPMFGSMELAWRIHKKFETLKAKAKVETGRLEVGPRIKAIG